MMLTKKEQITEEINEIFQSKIGIIINDDNEHFFKELDVDSLAFLNLIWEIEKQYKIRFVNENIPNYYTRKILVNAVLEQGEAKLA